MGIKLNSNKDLFLALMQGCSDDEIAKRFRDKGINTPHKYSGKILKKNLESIEISAAIDPINGGKPLRAQIVNYDECLFENLKVTANLFINYEAVRKLDKDHIYLAEIEYSDSLLLEIKKYEDKLQQEENRRQEEETRKREELKRKAEWDNYIHTEFKRELLLRKVTKTVSAVYFNENGNIVIDNGIIKCYFLNNYVPLRFRKEDDLDSLISRAQYYFKYSLDNTREEFFTNELYLATKGIVEQKLFFEEVKELVIVPVPGHQKNVCSNISAIAQNMTCKFAKEFNNLYGIKIECEELIHRITDIEPSHQSRGTRTWIKQYNSMSINNNFSYKAGVKYLVIDDIITSGSTLKACGKLLKKEGVSEEDIVYFAFGYTINHTLPDNEEHSLGAERFERQLGYLWRYDAYEILL